jgi:hypothetical protein
MNYKKEAMATHKSKAKAMGRENNLDIPVMRAVGENKKGGVHESSASMQHMKSAGAPGMKRGGRTGYPLTAGSQSGVGRVQKAHGYGLKPIK